MHSRTRTGDAICLTLCVLLAQLCGAQGPKGGEGFPTVTADLSSQRFDKVLPFDQGFIIVVPTQGMASFDIAFGDAVIDVVHTPGGGSVTKPVITHVRAAKSWSRNPFDDKTTTLVVPAIAANRTYLLSIANIVLTPSTATAQTEMSSPRRRRSHVRTAAPSDVAPIVFELLGESTGAFKDHFRSDVGLSWSPPPGPSYIAGASNVHMYLRPINDAGNSDAFGWADHILKRVSLFAGLTLFDLHTGKPPVDHMFTPGNPQVGLGFRALSSSVPPVLNSLYLNLGLVYFTQKDPNPLTPTEHGKHAPFIGLAGTIDWKDALGPIAVLLTGK